MTKNIITTTSDLDAFCAELAKHPFITIDTEFIREKTYYPILCLVQLASKKNAACIDPLAAGIDLTPLFDLLKNPKVQKIFHAARQDIEIFYHLMGEMPVNIFDTQIAAMVCGYGESVSYQQLVEHTTAARLDKGMRFTDWSKRPLSDKQTDYALSDVTHLIPAYEKLMAELKRTNRLSWLDEEQKILENPLTYVVEDENAWRRIKHSFKKPAQIHLFAALCAWRERTAKQKDRPRRHILKDEALLELTVLAPKTAEEMEALRGISTGFAKSDLGKTLLETIRRALADKPSTYEQLPFKKPLTSGQKNLLDMLRLLLAIVADQSGVAAKMITDADDLYAFAGGDPSVPFLKGWRNDLFGRKSVALADGKLALSYNSAKSVVEFIDKQ